MTANTRTGSYHTTDRTELSKRERQRARGTGPYSGNGPDAAAGMRSR